jgi:hypothetical protein
VRVAQPEHYRIGCHCIQCQKAVEGKWVERSKDRISQDKWLEGRVYYVSPASEVEMVSWPHTIRDQENRIRVAIDDLVEFLNVMGAD